LVTAGRGLFVHDGHRHHLRPGTIAVADPTVPHEILAPERDMMLVFWTVRIEPLGAPAQRWEDRVAAAFLRGHRAVRHGQEALARLLLPLAEQAMPAPAWASRQLLRQIAWGALAALCRQPPADEEEPPEAEDPVSRALAFIDAHCHRPMAAAEVAVVAGLSERQLRRRLQAATGQGLAALVATRRFNRAAQHLLMGATAREAAAGIGIADPAQFNRQFKACFGCPPAEWKRQNRQPFAPWTSHTEFATPGPP
jgi:AraC-like DNA-binding protein